MSVNKPEHLRMDADANMMPLTPQWELENCPAQELPWVPHLRIACELLSLSGAELIPAVSVTYTLQGERVEPEVLLELSQQLAHQYGLSASLTRFRPPVFTVRFTRSK